MSNIRTNNLNPFSTDQVSIGGKGVYLPTLTTAQRNAISSPADGLVIYNSDSHDFQHWNSLTSAWESTDGIQVLNGLSVKIQNFANGFTGSTPNWVSSGITHTLNIPMAKTANVTAGLISFDDWILLNESATMGVMEGGGIHTPSGLTATLQDGFGYLEVEPEIYFRYDWITQSLTFPANQVSYVFVNSGGSIAFSPIFPDTRYVILLGRVVTDNSNIIFIDNSPLNAEHTSNTFELFHRSALGPVYSSGSQVSESGTRNLNVTAGLYFLSGNKFSPAGSSPISWKAFKQDGSGGYVYGSQSVVDNAFYDNGTGTLAALTSSYYAKHSLYLVGDGAEETYMLVYSQAQYSALTLAEQGALPTPPPYFTDAVVLIASIIVQQGVTHIPEIKDERPTIAFKASGIAATTFHSNLLGLTIGDDHPQYWRNDGTHVATGNFDLGTHNIINLGTANGVVIEAHATRHNPGGADAVSTAAPITQGPDSTNTEGVATSLARSDHAHNIPTAVAIGLNAGTVNAKGTSTSFARADHAHAVASGAPSTQTPDQANTTGTSTNFARADHIHNIPAAAPVTTLSPATTNSKGVAASFALSDHAHAVATSLVGDITTIQPDDTASAGVVDKFARGDHKHAIATAAAITQTPDQANAKGTSTSFARADHVHNVPTAAPTTTLSPATTNAQGVAASFGRSDHTHAVATGLTADISTILPDDSAAAGTLDKFARADHKHAIATAAPSTQNPDQANAKGTSTSFARADHIHNIPAAIAVTIGTANAKGTSTSFSLADHVHAHGAQTDPTLHAVATASANGFMSSTDKSKVDGISGTRIIKSGFVAAGSFAGNPKTVTVTFGTAFPNTNYTIAITGVDSRVWSYQSKLAGSFVINSNANGALTGEVSWTAISTGETLE